VALPTLKCSYVPNGVKDPNKTYITSAVPLLSRFAPRETKERQWEKQKNTQRETEKDTERDTERFTERHTKRHTERHTEWHTERHTESHTERHAQRHTETHLMPKVWSAGGGMRQPCEQDRIRTGSGVLCALGAVRVLGSQLHDLQDLACICMVLRSCCAAALARLVPWVKMVSSNLSAASRAASGPGEFSPAKHGSGVWARVNCADGCGLSSGLGVTNLLFSYALVVVFILSVDFFVSLRHRELRTNSWCPEIGLGISFLGVERLV